MIFFFALSSLNKQKKFVALARSLNCLNHQAFSYVKYFLTQYIVYDNYGYTKGGMY